MKKYIVKIIEVDVSIETQSRWQKLYDSEVLQDRPGIESQYGYVESEETVKKESVIYEQVKEELDLSAIILAVNGLKA